MDKAIEINDSCTSEQRNGCLTVHTTYEQSDPPRIQMNAGRNGSCHNTWFRIAQVLINYILELGGDRKEVAKRLVDEKGEGVEQCPVPISSKKIINQTHIGPRS